ncbi:MAG: hypothetical protein HN731_15570 [Rhodospirillaceae bacterium]|nr:hypothetical protein [Rhodospirillaceae bacterium]MBT4937781.1 hypothetical protein [Rhodospirillaceae bacterium]MBT7956611.1 hypothetical protein [Rhodospirillaceae bacterium]
MKPEDYNYSVWNPGSESFEDFATKAPQVTSRAPSFPVEDLTTGEAVQLKDIWRKGVTIVEFGSFT